MYACEALIHALFALRTRLSSYNMHKDRTESVQKLLWTARLYYPEWMQVSVKPPHSGKKGLEAPFTPQIL
jgi:hypothetical protein